MFPRRYYPGRYFAPRYFPGGGEPTPPSTDRDSRTYLVTGADDAVRAVRGQQDARRVAGADHSGRDLRGEEGP